MLSVILLNCLIFSILIRLLKVAGNSDAYKSIIFKVISDMPFQQGCISKDYYSRNCLVISINCLNCNNLVLYLKICQIHSFSIYRYNNNLSV
jgi:hypothetical protein